MEEEHFADFETSKFMKELGFDNDDGRFWYSDKGEWMKLKGLPPFDSFTGNEVYAPLWQEVKEWLWEKWSIVIEGSNAGFYSVREFIIGIRHEDKLIVPDDAKSLQGFNSPITAEIEGIRQAVRHLHKQLTDK